MSLLKISLRFLQRVSLFVIGLVMLLFLVPSTATAADSPPPVSYSACPDKASFTAVAATIRPGLWPTGGTWTVQECSEADWAAVCKTQGIAPASADGMTVWTGRRIYIRQSAGTPTAIFAHELGHVIFPALRTVDTAGGYGYVSMMADFFGKGGTLPLLFTLQGDSAEEEFADAFALNRTARATVSDWGQDYIDGMLSSAWDDYLPAPPAVPASPVLLTGTPFADASGPNGGVGPGNRGPGNAFDGDLSTHYESQAATGCVGLHLAAPSVITQIVFAPLQYAGGRMVGSVFEASATGQDDDYHTIAVVTQAPTDGLTNTLTVTDLAADSYVRYTDLKGNHTKIAEVQVWGREDK